MRIEKYRSGEMLPDLPKRKEIAAITPGCYVTLGVYTESCSGVSYFACKILSIEDGRFKGRFAQGDELIDVQFSAENIWDII